MKKNKFQADKVFFTSDCHFDHSNIIKYCNRPFGSASEMNEFIIQNWNSVVPYDGTVFIHGDFCFGEKYRWEKILDRLMGEKYLIFGNHDNRKAIPYDKFVSTSEAMFVSIVGDSEIKEQQIYMSHYPLLTWNASHRGSWQTYGHIHTEKGKLTPFDNKLVANQYDVGVDNNDFTPVSFEELKTIITKRNLTIENPENYKTGRLGA